MKDEALQLERRAFGRYLVGPEFPCFLYNKHGDKALILDLSYGGCLIEQSTRASQPFDSIQVLDKNVDFVRPPIRAREINGQVAYRFDHSDSPTTLIFLRPFLESIAHGQQMVLLPPQARAKQYNDEDYYVYRGDGPTDLIVNIKEDHVETLILTFRLGRGYKELRYKNGALHTAETIEEGLSARVQQQANGLDLTTIRHSLGVFMGMKDQEIFPYLTPIQRLCLSALSLEIK